MICLPTNPMKSYLLILLVLTVVSCKNKPNTEGSFISASEIQSTDRFYAGQTDTIGLGDLDGNGVIDSAFVYTPQTNLEFDKNGDTLFSPGCKEDNCFNMITFSSDFPNIEIKNSVWGQIESIVDIDKDGVKELLFATNWFTTTRSSLYLFSLKNDRWVEISKVSFRMKDNEDLKDRIHKKDGKYYLIGVETIDGDEVDTSVEINFSSVK